MRTTIKQRLQKTTPIFTRRSALSLLFVALAFFAFQVRVFASSVGASGTFAGFTYQVEPGESLVNTGTQFSFVNNFSVPITVSFVYEAPAGVSINVPEENVTIAANGTYRFNVQITTTPSTAEGSFPIRILGNVIPDSASGVEVSGSAGLNATLIVQGISDTVAPSAVLVSRTDSELVIDIFNQDFDPVVVLYDLILNPPLQTSPILNPNESFRVTFPTLDQNTTYRLFLSAKATNRPESETVFFDFTTLVTPTPTPPTDPTPPPVVAPTPPSSGGGGGAAPSINVLVMEFSDQRINVPVFGVYTPPILNAYVSVRSNVRETSRIDVTNRVLILGEVNPNVLGRYVIRYILRYNNLVLEEEVEVFVVDNEPPRVLSAEEITILVDDPFVYQLIASDNYDEVNDLIITGFPSNIDTRIAGVQRFSVVVIDQSGNRTPFLFTVNVREREEYPIILNIDDFEITLVGLEGLFDPTSYVVDVASAVNQPLPNSPSWTRYTGQSIEFRQRELLYIRLTDTRGNTLIGVLNPETGRILPIDPIDPTLTGDPWWQVLFRFGNVLVWIVPFLLLLLGWIWFFFFLAKRRKKKEEEEPVASVPVAEKKRKAPPVAVFTPEASKPKRDTIQQEKRQPVIKPRIEDLDDTLEPLIQEPIRTVKPVVAAKVKPAVEEKPIKAKRKPRKPKQEVYAQVVALEQEGIMDDDLLGLELLEAPKKPVKDTLPEEKTQEPVSTEIDEKQIDIFAELAEDQPKPKRKKKDS